jgi:hypothetical protein
MTKEMEELRKNPVSTEVQTELEKLRAFQAVHDVKRTKEYRETVTAPLAAAESRFEKICAEFKMDPDKLFEVMRETEDWKRVIAIDKFVDDADNVPGGVKSVLHKVGDSLHEAWIKGSKIEANAAQLKAAQDALSEQGTTKQTYEQQQAWQKALTANRTMLESRIAPVIKAMSEDEKKEFFESLDSAAISDDPEERALQAHAPEVAAVLVRRLNTVAQENAALKKQVASLTNARPGAKERATGEDTDPNIPTDDDDFFSRVRQADDYRRR